MNRALRPPILTLLAGFVLLSISIVAPIAAPPAGAHGSTQTPASRVYTCRVENPNNPMCATAWSANSQALYDWMEVNIGDAAGRHQELIPDGQLCSAGRAKYAAFDQPGEWPVTNLRSDGSGLVDIGYQNTAPHSTAYYRIYITRNGFDARTDSLAWADLELAYDSGPLDRAAQQKMRAPLPNRDVPAILYIVWQRSDSPEAFYACSDVTVNGAPSTPPTSAATTPTTSAPEATSTSTSSAPESTTSSASETTPTSTSETPVAPTTTPTPTTASPTTAAPVTLAPSTEAPTTTSLSSTSTPLSSTSTTAAPSSPQVDDDSEAVPPLGASTGPSTPEATSSEVVTEAVTSEVQTEATLNQPLPVVGSADVGTEGDDLVLATQAAATADAETSGGDQWLLFLGAVTGLGLLGLAFLAIGFRRSEWFHQAIGSLLSRPATPVHHTSGADLHPNYYDVPHASR